MSAHFALLLLIGLNMYQDQLVQETILHSLLLSKNNSTLSVRIRMYVSAARYGLSLLAQEQEAVHGAVAFVRELLNFEYILIDTTYGLFSPDLNPAS